MDGPEPTLSQFQMLRHPEGFERPQFSLLIHSFNKYLPRINYVSGIMLVLWTGKQVQGAKGSSSRSQSKSVVKMEIVQGSSRGAGWCSFALPCFSLSCSGI